MRATKDKPEKLLSINHRLIILALVTVAILLSAWGCTPSTSSAVNKKTPKLTVAAAASLKPVLPKLAKAFREKTGIEIKTDFAASGLLARQIENGAPFDVYLSANKKYMDDLIGRNRITAAQSYAQGELVLIGKAGSLQDLKSPAIEKIAIANPSYAPYGIAAQEALVKSGLWPALKDKVVLGANIAQAYDYVRTGNVDAGIISLSMLKDSKSKYLLINRHLYHPIGQWAGVINNNHNQKEARKFLDYLSRPDAQKILKSFGYKIPSKAKP